MRNRFTEFKVFLQLLDPQDQLFEIECLIDDFINDNTSYLNIRNKYARIKKLQKLKHDLLQKL